MSVRERTPSCMMSVSCSVPERNELGIIIDGTDRALIANLIDVLAEARADLAVRDGAVFPMEIIEDGGRKIVAHARPAKGASPAQIAEAERVQGVRYPPQLRAMLEYANGFPSAAVGYDILGTESVGLLPGAAGYPAAYPLTSWGLARTALDDWFAESSMPGGGTLKAEDCIPISSNPITGDFHYIVASPGSEIQVGTVFSVEPDDVVEVGAVVDLLASFIEIVRAA